MDQIPVVPIVPDRGNLHPPQVVDYNLDQCVGLAKDKGRVVRVAQVTLEKISAVTLRVASMLTSVRFYRDLLGMEVVYGGEDSYFSSLRTKNGTDPILNLQQGKPRPSGGG